MAKSASAKRKRSPKSVLKLPDLEQSKTAVLNSLTSTCSQRTYEHAIREFIDWYCSEPRLAFNKTVVTRYRSPDCLAWFPMICVAPAHACAIKQAANWTRFNSS